MFRMFRASITAALALSALACSNEPEAPQVVPAAVSPPQEAADKEVLIATQPSEAKVLLKGAEVGTTPMKLLIREDTNIVLEKEGYVRQALMLTQKSDPNVIVALVPSGEPRDPAQAPEVAQAPEPPEEVAVEASAQKSSSAKGSSKKSGGKDESKGASEPTASSEPAPASPPAETAAQPEPAKSSSAPAAPKKTEYANMRQIKEAYRAGTITRDEYAYWQGIIRKNREAEFEATKQELRDGKITESQYKEKIRAIRAKYEG